MWRIFPDDITYSHLIHQSADQSISLTTSHSPILPHLSPAQAKIFLLDGWTATENIRSLVTLATLCDVIVILLKVWQNVGRSVEEFLMADELGDLDRSLIMLTNSDELFSLSSCRLMGTMSIGSEGFLSWRKDNICHCWKNSLGLKIYNWKFILILTTWFVLTDQPSQMYDQILRMLPSCDNYAWVYNHRPWQLHLSGQ